MTNLAARLERFESRAPGNPDGKAVFGNGPGRI